MGTPRRTGFSIDPRQGLAEADELRLVELGARLGYDSAWTPSGPDEAAFDRCLRWHAATGLPTGISVVPASGRPAEFYAEHAARAWEGSGHRFTLGVGSGRWDRAAERMRDYLAELRSLLPSGQPVEVAALGPLMLRVAGEAADGVLLNWCSPDWVTWSRARLERAAAAAGRPTPEVVEYIRTSVDPDPALARTTLGTAALGYALGPGAELDGLERDGGEPSAGLLAASGAAGAPGRVRPQFKRLARGLDLAIV